MVCYCLLLPEAWPGEDCLLLSGYRRNGCEFAAVWFVEGGCLCLCIIGHNFFFSDVLIHNFHDRL